MNLLLAIRGLLQGRSPSVLLPRNSQQRRFGGKPLLWAAMTLGIGYCVMIFGADSSPRIYDPLFGDRLHLLQKALQNKANPKPKLVVALGSSRTGNGLDALLMEQMLEARTGQPHVVFNFGIPGCGPVTQRLYLKRLLAAGIRPDMLLVEIYPMFLTDRGPEPLESQWLKPDRIRPAEAEFLGKYGIKSDRVHEAHREFLINPFGERRWQLLTRVLPTWAPAHVGYYWNRQTDSRGWYRLFAETVPETNRQANAAHEGQEISRLYASTHLGGPAVLALADLEASCQAEGIAIQWLLFPEAAEYRLWQPKDWDERLQKFLQSQLHEVLIDSRSWIENDCFADGHHLLPSGAKQFTAQLTEALLGEAKTPR